MDTGEILRNLQAGDILRISNLYVSRGVGFCSAMIWALVVAEAEGKTTVSIAVFFGPEETWAEPALDMGDTWVRVPDHKVPNYASAALAKWRLTGEKTSVRTSTVYAH